MSTHICEHSSRLCEHMLIKDWCCDKSVSWEYRCWSFCALDRLFISTRHVSFLALCCSTCEMQIIVKWHFGCLITSLYLKLTQCDMQQAYFYFVLRIISALWARKPIDWSMFSVRSINSRSLPVMLRKSSNIGSYWLGIPWPWCARHYSCFQLRFPSQHWGICSQSRSYWKSRVSVHQEIVMYYQCFVMFYALHRCFSCLILEATGDVGWGSEDFSLSKCVLEAHCFMSLNEFTVKLKTSFTLFCYWMKGVWKLV